MKVAVAGTGNVAQYLFEELPKHGHEVVVLTRSAKPKIHLEQRQTNYSIASLLSVLKDCEALVSTVADYQNPSSATQAHLDMLEACQRSDKCKTFIPSEWTCNVEDYPEQPVVLAEHNKTLHPRLKDETSVRWTIICNSWFSDYVVPKPMRHLPDIGQLWAMDHASKVFTIYGPGTQLVDFASVRDVAKAVAILLDSPEPWGPYTYISGEQLSWNDLFALIKRRDPEWTSQNKPLADTVQQLITNESDESVLAGYFEILSYSGASTLPQGKVERDREKYFPGMHFRGIEEILDAAAERPNEIV